MATDSLAADARELLVAAGPVGPGPDAIEQLGGWARIGAAVTEVTGDPVFVPLVSLVLRDFDSGQQEAEDAVRAVCASVVQTQSVTGFVEAVELFLSSPPALDLTGTALADGLLSVAGSVADLSAPTPAQLARAAHALEAATRLNVGGYGEPFALLAQLHRISDPAPPMLATAVIRSVGTVIDHWPHAAALVSVVRAQAAMTPPSGAVDTNERHQVESDASWVLGCIELVGALRAGTPAQFRVGLTQARRLFDTGEQLHEREDAALMGAVLDVLLAITDDTAAPTHLSLRRVAELDDSHLDRIVESTLRFNLTFDGLGHWYSETKRQSLNAWVALMTDLREARDHFNRDSFYRPEAVIDRLLQIYLLTHSTELVRNDADLGGVLEIVQPVIESGFASKAGFIANLDQYVLEFDDHLGSGYVGAEERASRIAVRDAAQQVLDAAREMVRRAEPPGKGDGGTAPAPLPPALEQLFSGNPHAAQIRQLDADLLAQLDQIVRGSNTADALTLIEAKIIDALTPLLKECADYNDQTAPTVDKILLLIVQFVGLRLNLQSGSMPYLFDPAATEQDLQDDLHSYLRSTLGPSVEMEVQNIGAGRVDIRVKLPTFAVHIELKHDDSKAAMADRTAYIKQAVAYQASDIRLGFLIALRTGAYPVGSPTPHITTLFEHATFLVPPDTEARHLILVQVPGNRTKPSAMKAT